MDCEFAYLGNTRWKQQRTNYIFVFQGCGFNEKTFVYCYKRTIIIIFSKGWIYFIFVATGVKKNNNNNRHQGQYQHIKTAKFIVRCIFYSLVYSSYKKKSSSFSCHQFFSLSLVFLVFLYIFKPSLWYNYLLFQFLLLFFIHIYMSE